MCGKGLYFLDDFIIPSLDSKRFPCLSWIDRDEKLYKVKWLHKGSRTWRENDFDIFSEWDRMKGHHNPQIPGYWTLAKQRFRNAHSKLEKIVFCSEICKMRNKLK
ncbi:interferon regulatory factor 4-like [Tachypleus tridentatus]|uniref:interferon regulatory factor 4-like n=1 Tax=Tachypleus tridentatus TaxID=6853 RepID=UPI003FD114A7